jgi:hypothetical protein
MSVAFFCAVILAALLLSAWCCLPKGNKDKALNTNKVVLGDLPIGCLLLCFVPQSRLKSRLILFLA